MILLIRINQYFDGNKTDDEILFRAEISRKQLREVLHQYDEYVCYPDSYGIRQPYVILIAPDVLASVLTLLKVFSWPYVIYKNKTVVFYISRRRIRTRMSCVYSYIMERLRIYS
jgi:hypothetical protein